mgnify:CR=1 FL=1
MLRQQSCWSVSTKVLWRSGEEIDHSQCTAYGTRLWTMPSCTAQPVVYPTENTNKFAETNFFILKYILLVLFSWFPTFQQRRWRSRTKTWNLKLELKNLRTLKGGKPEKQEEGYKFILQSHSNVFRRGRSKTKTWNLKLELKNLRRLESENPKKTGRIL